MLCDVNLDLVLRPIWHDDAPRVTVSCHDQSHDLLLDRTTTISFDFCGQGPQVLSVDLLNKTDRDTRLDLGLDKAVVIEKISFFGITDPRFIWAGRYRPIYPEPWASQQRALGQDPPQILGDQDRLSWNGHWWLDFDLPVFTWIHHVQNLGWIYR